MGKIGAFSGGYALNAMQNLYNGNSPTATHAELIKAGQLPFYVASAMALVAAAIAWFGLPEVGQDTIDLEDVRFREFLEANGYDTTQMGLQSESTENIVEPKQEKTV